MKVTIIAAVASVALQSVALLALFDCTQTAAAATFTEVVSRHATIVTITGKIMPDDDQRFINMAEAAKRSGYPVELLDLDPTGGDLRAAVAIADYIWLKDIGTMVNVTGTCASSCALIFFSSKDREITTGKHLRDGRPVPDGRVGVHRVSEENGAETRDTRCYSELLAAKLRLLGMPASVPALLLDTPPDRIAWIDPWLANRVPSVTPQPTASIDDIDTDAGVLGFLVIGKGWQVPHVPNCMPGQRLGDVFK